MISTHRRTTFPACIVLLHALAACGEQRLTEHQLSGPTMGTQFTVTVAAESEFDRESLRNQIYETLDDIDSRMSTYRANSELTQFNHARSTDWIRVSPELCGAVDRSLALSTLTRGAFDITVGKLVNLWGFGPDGSRHEPPADADIAAARLTTGHEKLHADCDRLAMRKDHAELYIDLSAYAKGLAADDISALLDREGIANYLVEIGGDLRTRGHNANNVQWRVAIEKPDETGRTVAKIIHISDRSVATSGDYRNFFESEEQRYSHTIDPRTGRPVTHNVASVTVLADSAAYADALATALMVLGPDDGLAFADEEGIAAYFLHREDNGIAERMSAPFSLLTDR